MAQQLPSAGSQLQQIPAERQQLRSAPDIRVKQGQEPVATLADQTKVIINSVRVTGMQMVPVANLNKIIGFKPGSELTLTDLRGMAVKLAEHYHKQGYFVAQAFLPPQDIEDGSVVIAVLEGQYGAVTLNNQTNLSNTLANSLLSGLRSGGPITTAALEDALLLLSDLPGINARSTMIPGATVGASDLFVDITQGPRVSGSVDGDNQGNRYTGQNRIGATISINEPFGYGDSATLRMLTSPEGLSYGRVAYQAQFGRVKAGLAFAALNYHLEQEFESLGAHGTAQIASIFSSYPLIRSRNNNLFLQFNFDNKIFQDRVDTTGLVTDKRIRVLTSTLNGDHLDDVGAGGYSNYSLAWSSGKLDIESDAALATDTAMVHSNGQYNKVNLMASRLQNLTPSLAVSATINAQYAAKNLDASEKMNLGGANAVRAYPEGESAADQAYVLNLEARLLLPQWWPALPGQIQAIGFIDTGSATLSKTAYAAGANHRTLSGAGFGFSWSESNNFIVKTYYAHKLGNAAAVSVPDSAYRLWIQGVKYF